MIKNFVLDTNVLIHNPNSIYSFSDNNVIIPITVIEELDKFKSSSDKKGMHARQVLREIDSCIKKGALKKGAKMNNGGTLKIEVGSQHIPIHNLDINKEDNKIISVAYDLHHKGETVFFISKDVNARIKAEALGIKARDYEKQMVEYSSLYRGWREINLATEEINNLYKNHEIDLKSYTLYENEYILIKSVDGNNSSAICKYNKSANKIELLKDNFEAMGIKPLNLQQKYAFDLLLNDNVQLVTLVGQAGRGKTLIAIACGLEKTLRKNKSYEKILVARPVIPLGKDIGYLPGSKNEKLSYWMQPIYDNLDFILSRVTILNHEISNDEKVIDPVENLIKKNILEIEALTYIRGRSIPNQFLIVDEAQNLTPHEIKTIISRAGEGTKIVLTGDPEQIDNPYLDANSNGLSYTVERLKDKKIVGHVFLSKSERSELATLAVESL